MTAGGLTSSEGARDYGRGLLLGRTVRQRPRHAGTAADLLRYAFQEMNLHRVELSVWGFNTDARRAYERCGFMVEGRRRDAVYHAGRHHDDVVMGVLASEWNATGPS